MRTKHLVFSGIFLVGLLGACSDGGRGSGGGDGGETLDPMSDECKDDHEPNDQTTGAAALTAAAPIKDQRACAGDVDFFSVTLAEGETIEAHAALGAGVAPESITLAITEASLGMVIAAGTADGDGLTVKSQPGKAGTYYVRVTGVGAGTNGYAVQATMTANTINCGAGQHAQNGACVDDGCDDFGLEPNEDITGGRRILPGTYKGLVACAGDVDYYILKAPAGGGALQVSVTNMQGNDVDVYATDGTMQGQIPNLLGAAQTGGDEDHIPNIPAGPGADVWVFVIGGSDTKYDIDFKWTALEPTRDCLMNCRDIISLAGTEDPSSPDAVVAGYFLEPEPQYLFGRRDFLMQIAWAFKKTAETFPGTNPVYVSDIGQADGDIPGNDVGDPRHPPDAHLNGHDADIAYFQTLPDNDYRIICGDGSDTNGNGQQGDFNDGYFCTTDQNVVDMPRQAFFIGMMAENPLYHVTGVDETLPDQIATAADALAASGKLPARAAYKVSNGLAAGNINLWPFHHHHIHTQVWNTAQPRFPLRYDTYF